MLFLESIRQQNGWPRVQLALTAAMDYERLCHLEAGVVSPTTQEAEKLAAVLNYTGSPAQLFTPVVTTTTPSRPATRTEAPRKIPLKGGRLPWSTLRTPSA